VARTLQEVVDRAVRYLHGPYRREFCILAVALNDSQVNVTLSETAVNYGAGPTIIRGTILNIGTEVMMVRAWDPNTTVATVVRGYLGTVAAAHAQDDMVDVNPRFPNGVLWGDLIDEITGLPESIYRTVTFEATTTTDERVVPLDVGSAGHFGVLGVRQTSHLTGEWGRYGNLEFLFRNTSAGDVLVLSGSPQSDGGTIEYRVKMPFDVSAATPASTFVDIEMPESMTDVLAMGVALRRLAWAEVQRSDRQAQGEPRIPTESPPMHAAQTAAQLQRVYDRRLNQEAAKLWARHGVKWA
jgi:hypothetical protein